MMQPTSRLADQQQVLEAADRVARAAHLWIRHGHAAGFPSPVTVGGDEVVAGIIFGLCDALDLDERHALLSAYVYALIDGRGGEAVVVAHSMLRRGEDEAGRSGYRQGLRAASDLVASLAVPDFPDGRSLPA